MPALLLGLLLWGQACLAMPPYQTQLRTRLGVSQEWTDNVQLMTTTGGEDFVTSVRPGFSAVAASEANGVEVDYDFGYSRYWELGQGFTQHNLRGNAWQQWDHLRLEVPGRLVRQEYPIEVSPETAAIIGLRDRVAPYYRAGAGPGLTWQFGEERLLRVGYKYAAYWSGDRRFQNSELNSPDLALTYAFNRFQVVHLDYTYERGDFSQAVFSATPDLSANRAAADYTYRFSPHLSLTGAYSLGDVDFASGPGYQAHQATLATTLGLTEHLALNLTAGGFVVEREGGGRSGPVLRGEITRQLAHGSLNAAGDWGFGENYFSAENLGPYEYWSGRANVLYRLWERLAATANVSWRRTDYFLRGRTDDYWSAGAGLSRTIRPWLVAAAGYTHTRYMSQASTGFRGTLWDFSVNSVVLNLTATYEPLAARAR